MLVGVQVIRVGKRKITAGTLQDAAQVCRLAVNSYRIYQRDGRLPGPITRRRQGRAEPVIVRDDDGHELYDLDHVRAENLARPGPGVRSDVGASLEELRGTPLRRALLSVAARGGLVVDPDTGLITDGSALPGGEPTVSRRSRQAQELRQLQRLGALGPASARGVVPLRTAGERALRRWGGPASER